MTTPRLKRGSLRSRSSASVFNRTVDSLQRTNRLSTTFGGPASSVLVYHSMRTGPIQTQAAVSCSGGAWVIDPEAEWVAAGLSPHDIAHAYELASIYRTDYPDAFGDLTGGDLLYAAAANPHGCVGADPWVWGDETLYENAAATPITVSPDTWHYPGGFCGALPWAGNPNIPESGDDPGWALSDGNEQWSYEFYPLVEPGSPAVNRIMGGLPPYPVDSPPMESRIHCDAVPLGLPEFVRQCPRGTVVHEALLEVGIGGAEWTKVTTERANATDPPTVTTAVTATGDFNMVLMGEQRVGNVQKWSPLGGGIAGTGTENHSAVVDVTGVVMRLLELSGKGSGANSPYAHFALLPANVATLAGATDARSVLRGLAPIPTLAWDAVAGEWFVAYAQFRQLTWTNPSLGRLALTFSYPYGEVQRCVISDFWPICTSEEG